MAARPHDADEPEAVEPEPVDPPPGDGERAPAREPGPADVEARWLEIVARLQDTPTGPGDAAPGLPGAGGTPDPQGTSTTTGTGGSTGAGPGDGVERPRIIRPAAPTGPRAWAPDPAVEEAEDHFEPPDPGPVLSGDPLLTMAWAAAVGVPALLLVAVVAWRDIPTIVLEAAGVAFVCAVGLLLWRMPRHRDDDSGPGAVV